jgi:crossover junction endodeoxyribonuclease RusA
MIPGILVTLPIRTSSPNGGNPGNRRAAVARSREKKEHRLLARMMLGGALGRRGLKGCDLAPVVVTMTRVSPGTLDDDNLASACKAARDGIADALGIDDGDTERLRFVYRQRKADKGQHAVEVLVEQRDFKPQNPPPAPVLVPVPSHAQATFAMGSVPRCLSEGRVACTGIPKPQPLPFDERPLDDPERRAWWAANWQRVVWRAHQCETCGSFWNVRELLERPADDEPTPQLCHPRRHDHEPNQQRRRRGVRAPNQAGLAGRESRQGS